MLAGLDIRILIRYRGVYSIKFIQSTLVPSAFEGCFKPGFHYLHGKNVSHNASAQNQYIRIVMAFAHNRGKKIRTQSRSDMRKFVGNH
jgi:hypothetical protein